MNKQETSAFSSEELGQIKTLLSKLSVKDRKEVFSDTKKSNEFCNFVITSVTLYITTALVGKGSGIKHTLEKPINLKEVTQRESFEAVKKAAEKYLLKNHQSLNISPDAFIFFKANYRKEGNGNDARILGLTNSHLLYNEQMNLQLATNNTLKH